MAELERKGGFRPRTSPSIRSSEFGSLLHKAGFKLLTVDKDEITIEYPSMIDVISDLKAMGESNCAINRANMLSPDTLLAASAIYQEMYGYKLQDNENVVPATFEFLFFIGWTPDPTQIKPLERGTAELSLKDLNDHLS